MSPCVQRDEHTEYYKRIKRQLEGGNSSDIASGISIVPPVQQRFETLAKAPLLPIIEVTRTFIERLASVPIKSYLDQVIGSVISGLPSSTSTAAPEPTENHGTNLTRRLPDSSSFVSDYMFRRQDDAGSCSDSAPCSDGSCCNNQGKCGFGPANCGVGNCTNNCNATAECGRDSAGGDVSCPLNVCCSYYGYCGVRARVFSIVPPAQFTHLLRY
jgi:hypothetical protein